MTSIHPATGTADRHDYEGRVGLIGWQRTAWSSVLMAAVTAIALQFVFTALGFAIGATAVEVGTAGATDAGNVGFAAGAWWLITGTIALIVGGLTLGRVSGLPQSTNLILAALTVWAVTAVFGFFVVWSGMTSAASSPLAGMSTPAFDTATGAAGAETTAAGAAPTVAQAQEAARTASWWTVIGMLIGAAATVGGAWISAPKAAVPVRN